MISLKSRFKFIFTGTVRKYGNIICKGEYVTYADNSHKALSNISYQIKSNLGLVGAVKLVLDGVLTCYYSNHTENITVKNNVVQEEIPRELEYLCKPIGNYRYKLLDKDTDFAREMYDFAEDNKITREKFIEFYGNYVQEKPVNYGYDEDEDVDWKDGIRFGEEYHR